MKKKHDLIETANLSGEFRVFTKAVEAAGLTESLKESGPYTILAPTDEAFTKVPKAKIEYLFKPENKESLQELLRNHIVPRTVTSRELKELDEVRTVKGLLLKIASGAGLSVNEAQICAPDLVASNGVVHGIDAVLLPRARAAGEQ